MYNVSVLVVESLTIENVLKMDKLVDRDHSQTRDMTTDNKYFKVCKVQSWLIKP